MERIFIVLIIFAFVFGCGDNDKTDAAVANIEVDLDVVRFDQEFAEALPADIPGLRRAYPYLFPERYSDSVWVAKLTDTLQTAIHAEVDAVFGDFGSETEALTLFFKHVKYYFPKYRIPKVVTLISDVDYENRVILTDSLLLLGLDNYLGPEHRFYRGMQRYVAAGMEDRFLISDVASAFAKSVVPRPRTRAFLARAIFYGKELYLKDRLLPFVDEAVRIHFSDAELQWAKESEEPMWRYFVERELLYDTDVELDRRFLDPAPFSKFGLELDNESPGRMGRYLGWQIVRAFMARNDVTLNQMLGMPAEQIFKESNYKPNK